MVLTTVIIFYMFLLSFIGRQSSITNAVSNAVEESRIYTTSATVVWHGSCVLIYVEPFGWKCVSCDGERVYVYLETKGTSCAGETVECLQVYPVHDLKKVCLIPFSMWYEAAQKHPGFKMKKFEIPNLDVRKFTIIDVLNHLNDVDVV